MVKTKALSVVNQKAGEQECHMYNLGANLGMNGKKLYCWMWHPKVILLNAGQRTPYDLKLTQSNVMNKIVVNVNRHSYEKAMHHPEVFCFVPIN